LPQWHISCSYPLLWQLNNPYSPCLAGSTIWPGCGDEIMFLTQPSTAPQSTALGTIRKLGSEVIPCLRGE
jgi:hypothetical protein